MIITAKCQMKVCEREGTGEEIVLKDDQPTSVLVLFNVCCLNISVHNVCFLYKQLLDVFREFLFLLSPSSTIQQLYANNQVASVC